ncbi:MAG: Glu-tRNA(Gln) amidotransferase subunit GatD [Methanomassiliicoccales archaeon]
MPLNPLLRERLDSLSISEGDEIRIRTPLAEYKGLLMPHHAFSGDNVVVLKLRSGYNVGVAVSPDTEITLLRKGEPVTRPSPERMPQPASLPHVAFIGTGGTIASFVDYRTGGVLPALNAHEIEMRVPEISGICSLEGGTLFSVFSENMFCREWAAIAMEAASRLNDGAHGVIIAHGTDTMAYTASALAFMLGRLSGPVVLTGAQRSPDRPSFDGYLNLIGSARIAGMSDIGEVTVVMHADSSDKACHVHRGTRVRKMHSSRRDAFRSLNAPPIAIVDENITYLSAYRRTEDVKVRADVSMSSDGTLITFFPGMSEKHFLAMTEGCRGIVLAGSGLGHVSTDIISGIRKRVREGIPVVVTTQCLGGSVNMRVYSTGRDMIAAGAVEGGDMLPEVAYVKLLWALAHFEDMQQICDYMQSDIAGEISGRRFLGPLAD